jgi:polyisoprenoid-binding protein YceI
MKALIVAVSLALPSIAAAAQTTWDIDGTHSNVGFQIKHMMVANVRGEFGKFTGSAVIDDADVTKSKITATIDAASINTHDEKRDGHLRSPDFFDTAKFPNITFTSKSVKKVANGYEIAGDLTMHGVTKPVTLKAGELSNEVKDPWGGTRRALTATTTVSRKDFGISWNTALDNGGVMLGDDVQINLDISLVKKAPSKT